MSLKKNQNSFKKKLLIYELEKKSKFASRFTSFSEMPIGRKTPEFFLKYLGKNSLTNDNIQQPPFLHPKKRQRTMPNLHLLCIKLQMGICHPNIIPRTIRILIINTTMYVIILRSSINALHLHHLVC